MAALDKDTVFCISIASRPSNFGTQAFNALFSELGMNWAYKAFKVEPSALAGAIAGIRALGIRGCGVSMPHKTEVMKLLDRLDGKAKIIGAVNTIVNDNGTLVGYNTDWLGAKRALEAAYPPLGKRVLVCGAGGAARAAVVAIKELGAGEILVVNRTSEKARAMALEFGCRAIGEDEIASCHAHLFFNATPVGMNPSPDEMPLSEADLAGFEAVADVVVSPARTKLISSAQKLGKTAIPGWRMAMMQAAGQFELYTSRSPPMELMEKTYRCLAGM